MNPFEDDIFGKNYKLVELYHYYVGLDDKAEINKTQSEDPNTIFYGFLTFHGCKSLFFLFFFNVQLFYIIGTLVAAFAKNCQKSS